MVRILASQPIPLDPQCTLCERHRGYNEHLGADKHWRALYPTFTGEGVCISQVRDRVWNRVRISGGWVLCLRQAWVVAFRFFCGFPLDSSVTDFWSLQVKAKQFRLGSMSLMERLRWPKATRNHSLQHCRRPWLDHAHSQCNQHSQLAAWQQSVGWVCFLLDTSFRYFGFLVGAGGSGPQQAAGMAPQMTPPMQAAPMQSAAPAAGPWANYMPQGAPKAPEGWEMVPPFPSPQPQPVPDTGSGWPMPTTEPHSFGPPAAPNIVNLRQVPPDSVSMASFSGRRSEIDERFTSVSGSMSGRVGRDSEVASAVSSHNPERLMERYFRTYRSKAKAVQEQLQSYQVPPFQIRCELCQTKLEITEVASHFSNRAHFDRTMLNSCTSNIIVSCFVV